MGNRILKKINAYLEFIIWFVLIVALFTELYYQRWLVVFIIIIVLASSFIPQLIEKRYKIDIPREFEIIILFFIFLSIFLGEVYNFYHKFWWWDSMLHGFSAVSLGLIGFVVILYLYRGNEIRAKPVWLCVFAFSFALAIGAVWEIFEFGMDQFFGLNMQKSGLVDTMWDLIIDSIGAAFASISGYIYLRNEKSAWAHPIKAFVELNESLFE